MLKELLPAVKFTIILAILTGLIFPISVTIISQALFPDQANGSLLISASGKIIGSKLIAQKFESAKYFHPRPSAAGAGYAGEASGGTNLGPTSRKLIEGIEDDPKTKTDESFSGIKQLAEAYRKENGIAETAKKTASLMLIPVDAVTRSGSGLDPDISEANAILQASRVANARHMDIEKVVALVTKTKVDRDLGLLGEPRINVLLLNLALDRAPTN